MSPLDFITLSILCSEQAVAAAAKGSGKENLFRQLALKCMAAAVDSGRVDAGDEGMPVYNPDQVHKL